MTFLFAMMILAVFLGGVLLWLSGLTVGLRSDSDSDSRGDRDLEKLRQDRGKLAAEASAETARVVEEMERVENELTMAAEKMKLLKDENEALKAKGVSQESKPSTPTPPPLPPTPPPLPPAPPPLPDKAPDDSEDLDSAQNQLDLEKAAHRKTLDDLAAIKNLLSIKIAESSDPSGDLGPQKDRNSAGFKTMSIDNRSQSVSGTDHDRLRQSYDQNVREKDRLETELARTQQELQLLKMRQK